MSDRVNPNIVSGNSKDWQDTRELLGEEHNEVGVFSFEQGTEVLNGSREALPAHAFKMGGIDAVKGNYVVFPEEVIEGLREQVETDFIGPEDMNDANFYVGQSTGVPWFELKLERDYTIPTGESPHVHGEAWEFYGFEGGDAVLDVANKDYDFNDTEVEEWDLRDGVSQLNAFDGKIVAVPPGVPHQVNTQYGNPDLVVAKYSPLHERGDIGKYGLDGKRTDPWAEGDEQISLENNEALH